MEKQIIIITIGVLILFLAVMITVGTLSSYPPVEGLGASRGTQFYRCPTYTGGKIMDDLYRQMGFKLTRNPQLASVYLPCGYTLIEKELKEYDPIDNQVVLGIDGCDQIVAKNGLWKVLSDKYGRDRASQLVPRSYVTGSADDLQHLKREYNPNKIYIMKKNIQRQQGLKLTKDLPEMLASATRGYAVIQEYLMNPLLLDKRKFDMRVYLLVCQKGGTQHYYRHTEGRCHYSSRNFTTTDLTREIHIPCGYDEDAAFKAAHPETLKELQAYLGERGDFFFKRLDEMLRTCCIAFSGVLGTSQKFSDHGIVQCQLFGLDFLSDDTLRPVLIEINKGPEMAWSSEPERLYKIKIATDMFNLLGYADVDTPNEFIHLLTV